MSALDLVEALAAVIGTVTAGYATMKAGAAHGKLSKLESAPCSRVGVEALAPMGWVALSGTAASRIPVLTPSHRNAAFIEPKDEVTRAFLGKLGEYHVSERAPSAVDTKPWGLAPVSAAAAAGRNDGIVVAIPKTPFQRVSTYDLEDLGRTAVRRTPVSSFLGRLARGMVGIFDTAAERVTYGLPVGALVTVVGKLSMNGDGTWTLTAGANGLHIVHGSIDHALGLLRAERKHWVIVAAGAAVVAIAAAAHQLLLPTTDAEVLELVDETHANVSQAAPATAAAAPRAPKSPAAGTKPTAGQARAAEPKHAIAKPEPEATAAPQASKPLQTRPSYKDVLQRPSHPTDHHQPTSEPSTKTSGSVDSVTKHDNKEHTSNGHEQKTKEQPAAVHAHASAPALARAPSASQACGLCKDSNVQRFSGCGHVPLCSNCAEMVALGAMDGESCKVCRQPLSLAAAAAPVATTTPLPAPQSDGHGTRHAGSSTSIAPTPASATTKSGNADAHAAASACGMCKDVDVQYLTACGHVGLCSSCADMVSLGAMEGEACKTCGKPFGMSLTVL